MGQGFEQAAFVNGICWAVTSYDDKYFTFKLRERPGNGQEPPYQTWHKAIDGGALIVLEVAVGDNEIHCDGYCPLLLFGIWEKKLSLKPDAPWPFKSRAEGWHLLQALEVQLQELAGGF